MKSKIESKSEKRLVDKIRRLGGRAYKFVSPGRNGVPDRIVILENGEVIFVEMKKVTGRLSDSQKLRIEELRNLNQRVTVLYGDSGVDKFIDLVNRSRLDLITEEMR